MDYSHPNQMRDVQKSSIFFGWFCTLCEKKHDTAVVSFLPKGGGKMRLYGLLGGRYVSVCKACSKVGGSGGMLPREIFILDLLLDTIWWNLGLWDWWSPATQRNTAGRGQTCWGRLHVSSQLTHHRNSLAGEVLMTLGVALSISFLNSSSCSSEGQVWLLSPCKTWPG